MNGIQRAAINRFDFDIDRKIVLRSENENSRGETRPSTTNRADQNNPLIDRGEKYSRFPKETRLDSPAAIPIESFTSRRVEFLIVASLICIRIWRGGEGWIKVGGRVIHRHLVV